MKVTVQMYLLTQRLASLAAAGSSVTAEARKRAAQAVSAARGGHR